MAHVLLRKVGSGGLAIPDQTGPGVCPVDGPFPTACGWNVEGNLALSSLWLRGRKMKPRIISFATVLALSSTLAFGQSGGSGGSSGSSGVGSSVGSSIGGPSDVNTSGALGRGATEPLRQTRTDRSNTNLGPSDPRIGQNSRNARASINKLHRHSSGLRSPISRTR